MPTDTTRTLPPASTRLARTIAVPPIRDVPNEQSVELLWSGFSNLAAGGVAFIPLTDPSTGQAFMQKVIPQSIARLATMLVYCPDMVAAAAPYLFLQMQISGQNANAWNFVPVYPRSGVASLTFPMSTDLAQGASVQLFAKNTDVANTHFLAVYLYGWYWPKNLVQA